MIRNNCINGVISYICQNEYEYFLNKKNVVGVAQGYKRVNGFYTCEPCITVFVREKVSLNNLSSEFVVPHLYKGIKIDVIQSGAFKIMSFTNRVRPVLPGYAIGNIHQQEGGTYGCLVTDGTNYYILSNNHVMAINNPNLIGSDIIQPSIFYGGRPIKDVIAKLSKFIPVKYEGEFLKPANKVDCAIAKVVNRSMVSPEIALIGKPKGVMNAVIGQKVQKVGAVTELTTGVITHLDASIEVDWDSEGKVALFKNQVIATKMADYGDSGSLVMYKNNYVIGLLSSGTKSAVVINPITSVLQSLNVSLVLN